MKSRLAVLVLALAMQLPCFGQQQTNITFDGSPYIPPNSQYGTYGYAESGFVFSGNFDRTYMADITNGYPNDGSTYLQEGIAFSFYRNGNPFGLVSVDLAAYSTLVSNMDITFVGDRADGTTITSNFSGMGVIFRTYYFGPDWASGLTNVQIGNADWSMDNLVVTTPPPPPPPPPPPGQDFDYTVESNSVIITGYKGTNGTAVIPDAIMGEPVTAIAPEAFNYSSSVTNVIMPDTLTNVGDYAFDDCPNLTSVVFGTNCLSIGTNAFEFCGALTNFVLPDSLVSLGDGAFRHCQSLTDITVPAQVLTLPASAFAGCANLSNVTLPGTLRTIGDNAFAGCAVTNMVLANAITNLGAGAFSGCANLASVNVPTSLHAINANTFADCTTLANLVLPAGITSLGDGAFFQCANLQQINLPQNLVSIGSNTFYFCTSLPQILITRNVASIGDSAFAGCDLVPTVTIPQSVTNIGAGAFADGSSLTNIFVSPLNPNYLSIAGVLFSKDKTVLMQFPGGAIGDYAIPNSVASVADFAFYGCETLAHVTIPPGVTNLGQWAFKGCNGLTNIAIPAAVIGIGEFALLDCYSLQAIDVDDTNPAYSSLDGVLFDKNETLLIQYPGGKTGSYTVPSGVSTIGGWAFTDCTNLTKIIFPASVTNIMYTFDNCPNLKSVLCLGDAPTGIYDFLDNNQTTVYYEPGHSGWENVWAGLPKKLWNPQIQMDANLGLRTNGFNFTITGATNLTVVVEASSSLADPQWSPAGTNALDTGSAQFTDAESTNYPARFYRLTPP